MAIKKHLLHWLLALGIGLLPVMNASAISAGHAAGEPMNCLDCGLLAMHQGDPCQDQDCVSTAPSCHLHSAASCLPAAITVDSAPSGQAGIPDRPDTLYPKDIDDSIYRPPIT